MAFSFILVGTGGKGADWCKRALPPNIADGLIKPVAAVDVVSEHLRNAQTFLGLPANRCYTDIHKAFDENSADFAIAVVPPAVHESVVDVALAHDCHILSEKPIADTMDASVRIAKKVKKHDKKMGVTMSHRFRPDITTLRKLLFENQYGPLDYLICRFTCAMRERGGWGHGFRYDIPDTLMVEGSVHHLDFLCDLASQGDGTLCESIYAQTWDTEWSDFSGDSQALVTMRNQNGKRIFYEGAKTNAAGLNNWQKEYIRAECRDATIIMNHGAIEVLPHGIGQAQRGEGRKIPLLEQEKWSNTWLCEKFVQWLDGGESMETNVESNLQSVALIFSGIESNRKGQPIKVQDFLNDHLDRVSV